MLVQCVHFRFHTMLHVAYCSRPTSLPIESTSSADLSQSDSQSFAILRDRPECLDTVVSRRFLLNLYIDLRRLHHLLQQDIP
jgi:hypothetical protein